MRVLGLSAFYHDSAAALVIDGDIIAAAQEERFTRRKHDAEFPAYAVAYCLQEAGLRPDQLDYVAYYEKPLTKFERLLETYLAFAPQGFRSFSQAMPRWTEGELIEAPRITWRTSLALIGPGLVMSASAIGGGEWLLGPEVTAKYGRALIWLAAMSIVFQALYNIEISRYTLYCGEPIFSGKFRTLPGPLFWLALYLMFDFSTVFPYLAASAVVPIEVLMSVHSPYSLDSPDANR